MRALIQRVTKASVSGECMEAEQSFCWAIIDTFVNSVASDVCFQQTGFLFAELD